MSDWKEVAYKDATFDATRDLKVMVYVEEHVKDLLAFGSTEIVIEVDHILESLGQERVPEMKVGSNEI